MVIKRFLLSIGFVSLLMFIPATVSAQVTGQNALPGASNAADYQPPTGNPQNDVGGVSQGQTNQNNLQKPETVDQTALPNVPDLRVPGVKGDANTNTTKTEVTTAKNQKSVWAAIFLGVAAVAAVVLLLSSGLRRKTNTADVSEEPNDVEDNSEAVKDNDAQTVITDSSDIIDTPETKDTADVAEVVVETEPSASQDASKSPPVKAKKTSKPKKGKHKKTKRKR